MEETYFMYIQITIEISIWLKGKYFAVLHEYNAHKIKIKIKEIYVFKDIYLYLYKKIHGLRKLVVTFISVIRGKVFIRYRNI